MLPEQVLDPPTLPEELTVIVVAFFDLIHDRSMFMGGIGGMWWSSMQAYVDRLGVDQDTSNFIIRGIRVADNVYVSHVTEQTKTQSGAAQGGIAASRGRSIPRVRRR